MTGEQFIKAQLAALAHQQAAYYGGLTNMMAVAFIVRNRVMAGIYGGDWLKVIAATEELSAHPPAEVKAPDLRDPLFRMFLQKIDDVYSGMEPDRITAGALFYCELNRVERSWFRENILANPDSHPRVGNVASMVLFK